MRVLSGIVDVLGDLVVHMYRSYSAAKANKQQIPEKPPEPEILDRRSVYLAQIARDPIDCVDDPCVAVTSMMCAILTNGADLTREQASGIRDRITEIFKIDFGEAEDILNLSRWTIKAATSLDDCMNRLGLVIHRKCNMDEKMQVLDMLQYAAGLDGEINERQWHAITRLRYRLGI